MATKQTTTKKPARATTAAKAPAPGKSKPVTAPKPKDTKTATRATTAATSGKPKGKPTAKPGGQKRTSLLDRAADILAKAKEPMGAKDIVEKALAEGWTTKGKTPAATLYASIIREIANKGKDARFTKVERGRFASRKPGA